MKNSCQSKESPLSKQSPLYSNPSLSRKNISPHIYIVKLEEVNPPFIIKKGGGEHELCLLCCEPILFTSFM